MHKLTIPTILIATVLVTGIFAFMPIDKATTVHSTIQSTQMNQYKAVFVESTTIGNATGGCGSSNSGLAYWTVMNRTLSNVGPSALTNSTFILTIDGDTDDGDEIQILLNQNKTTASGIVAFTGASDPDIIIGAPNISGSGIHDVGSILLSIQCQSGDTVQADSVAP